MRERWVTSRTAEFMLNRSLLLTTSSFSDLKPLLLYKLHKHHAKYKTPSKQMKMEVELAFLPCALSGIFIYISYKINQNLWGP